MHGVKIRDLERRLLSNLLLSENTDRLTSEVPDIEQSSV